MRWVMVRKRDKAAPAPAAVVPPLAESAALDLPALLPETIELAGYDTTLGGSEHLWEDYEPGERIDHLDGMTIEESCHMTATRLYQNTAKVHFNQHAEKDGRFGRRIVYGGHVISLARALSFNGLANAFRIAGINAGRHVNPCFAGDTVYAWSEVKAKPELPDRRRGRAAPPDHRHQGPVLRRFSHRGARDPARPRLHRADAAALTGRSVVTGRVSRLAGREQRPSLYTVMVGEGRPSTSLRATARDQYRLPRYIE